jgi:hypothetical protein
MNDLNFLIEQTVDFIADNIEEDKGYVFCTSFDDCSNITLDFISRFYPNSTVIFFDDGQCENEIYLHAEYLMYTYDKIKYDIISSDKSTKWLYTLYNDLREGETNSEIANNAFEYENVFIPLKKYFMKNDVYTVFFLDLKNQEKLISNNPQLNDMKMEYSTQFMIWKIYPFLHWTEEDIENYHQQFSIIKLAESHFSIKPG